MDPSQLADSMDVTRRTVFRDIAALNDLGYEIQFDPLSQKYFHKPPASLDSAPPPPSPSPPSADASSPQVSSCGIFGGSVSDGGIPKWVQPLTRAIAEARSITISGKACSASSEGDQADGPRTIFPVELVFLPDGWHLRYRSDTNEELRCLPIAQSRFYFGSSLSPYTTG